MEVDNDPDIEDFKPADEIERLQNINADLLEACKYAIEQLKSVKGKAFPITPILNAIARAEGGELCRNLKNLFGQYSW